VGPKKGGRRKKEKKGKESRAILEHCLNRKTQKMRIQKIKKKQPENQKFLWERISSRVVKYRKKENRKLKHIKAAA